MRSLSDTLSRDGQFWLPEQPDRVCFGQLSFDPTTGIDLKLFGSLKQIPETFNNPEVPNGLLHGRFENGTPISLFGSFRKSHQMTLGNGFPREIYRINLAAIGVHVTGTDEKQFSKATLDVTGLKNWLGNDWYPDRVFSQEGRVFSVQTRPPTKEIIFKNRRYSILVNRFSSINHEGERVSVSPKADMELTTSSAQSIDWFLKKSSALVSLLSFCLAQLTEIESISLAYEESECEHAGPKNHEVEIIYARINHSKIDLGNDVLAPFPNLKQPRQITKEWMNLYSRAKSAIRLVHEVQSDQVKYVNLRFLLAAQAAESFHREVFCQKNKSLRRRLDDLVIRLGCIIGYTPNGLSKSFLEKTVRTRNYNTHFSAVRRGTTFSPAEMYWASQRLAALITILALDKIGVDAELIRTRLSRRDDISRILRIPGMPY